MRRSRFQRALLWAAVHLGMVMLPLSAAAQPGGGGRGLQNPLQCGTLPLCLVELVKGALGLVGVIAVGMIVYGGFLYITSGGNDDQVKQGKQAVVGAVMGIIVIGLAYAIVAFVAGALGVGGGAQQGVG